MHTPARLSLANMPAPPTSIHCDAACRISLHGDGVSPQYSLSDKPEVVAFAAAYRWWIALAPIAGMAAFIWDGVFVGLTATRQMLLSLAGATAAYFAIYFLSPFPDTNSNLWTAFLTYLAVRGVILWLCFARKNEY